MEREGCGRAHDVEDMERVRVAAQASDTSR